MPIGFAYFREVVEPCLPNLSDKMGSPKVEKYDAYIVSKLLFLQLFHAMDCAKGTVSKALSNVEVFIKLLMVSLTLLLPLYSFLLTVNPSGLSET